MVLWTLENAWGGEIFVPKIPSYRITDVATAIGAGVPPGRRRHPPGREDPRGDDHRQRQPQHRGPGRLLRHPAHGRFVRPERNTASAPARRRWPRASPTTAARTRSSSASPSCARSSRPTSTRATRPSTRHDSLRPPGCRRSRHARGGGGAALGLPDARPGRAAIRGRRGRLLRRRPCRRGQQRHQRPAHRLPGAGRGTGRPRLDQRDHLRGQRQLRTVLRRRRRLRRHRSAHLQHERGGVDPQARSSRAGGHAAQGGDSGAPGRAVVRHAGHPGAGTALRLPHRRGRLACDRRALPRRAGGQLPFQRHRGLQLPPGQDHHHG